MTSHKWRIGIAGRRGLAYAPAFRSLERAELVAFCDTDGAVRRQAAQQGVPKTFERFADMLATVDAVVVATPMQLHAVHSVMALSAGKHVLSEVTAAVTLDECWRLLDAVRASGRTYMMAENYCYLRPNVLIREMVRRGLFGDVYFGEGEYLHEVRELHHAPDGSPTWRYFWQVGAGGATYGTHSLGPVMQWMAALEPEDRVESVVCLGSGRRTDPEHPHDDTSLMLCKLRSGKLVKVRLDMISNRPSHATYYALQGTRGVYEASRVEGEPGHVWIGEGRAGEERHWRPLSDFDEYLPPDWRDPPPNVAQSGHGGGDYFVARDFVQALETGAPPIGIHQALEWTAAGLCSQVSLEHGGVPVKVPDFRDPSQRPVRLDAPADMLTP